MSPIEVMFFVSWTLFAYLCGRNDARNRVAWNNLRRTLRDASSYWRAAFAKWPKVTAAEFERDYAGRSGMTVNGLREMGRVVARCDCHEPDCLGWRSISRRSAEEDGLKAPKGRG